jgi:hypothetical protein
MLQADSDTAKAALLVDACIFAGVTGWHRRQDLISTMRSEFGMSRRIVLDGTRSFAIKKRTVETTGRGRPPHEYHIPNAWTLAMEYAPLEVLKTKWGKVSDVLQRPDLRSMTTYRQALHRELIRRLYYDFESPVEMSRALQASRLGCTPRTVRRYDDNLGTVIEAQFRRDEVTKQNYHQLPEEKEPGAQWLEVQVKAVSGAPWQYEQRAMPAVRVLAYQALARGQRVELVTRMCNRYAPGALQATYRQPVSKNHYPDHEDNQPVNPEIWEVSHDNTR